MKIFTTQEIQEIDRFTIESEGIKAIELVERAAEGISCEIASQWNPSKPLAVFAGSGNNGADALATARLLAEQGFRPEVFLFNIGGDRLSQECRTARDLLLTTPGVDFVEVVDNFALPDLTANHLVIDGLFGSGLREPLKGGFISLVRYINESGATVVSIDVPSGLMGEWNPGAVNRDIIHANLTLCIQFPRLSFFIDDYADLVGEWKVIDIDLSPQKIKATPAHYHLVERSSVKRLLNPRPLNCSKSNFGSAIIYAGSYGMMGAAIMAAKGALRSGVGKLTVCTPTCGNIVLQTAVPEAMYLDDEDNLYITSIKPDSRYNAVAIGPGLNTQPVTVDALEAFLASAKEPVVLDADALNCISMRPSMLETIPYKSVITPHAGEFDRLFGAQPSGDARLRKAIEVARKYNIYVVLKGRYTAIVRPDGKVYFNGSGSPALATPGSGDVLTGVICSMMAQGYSPEAAAIIGVYVHGTAGELSAKTHGAYGVMAGDIADNVGRAIYQIMSNNQ